MTKYRVRCVVALVAALAVVTAACAGDDSATTTTAPPTTAEPTPEPEPADTTTTAAPEPEPEPEPDPEPEPVGWEQIVPGGDCECAYGTEFSFYVREADPTKVVLYFQGGGACFTEATCSPGVATATTEALPPGESGQGIFDFDDPRNPIGDHSVVFVPYCTGDVHLGTITAEYSDTLSFNHKGFINASAALDHLIERFPDAATLVVSGESAGSIPSPLFGGLLADEYPEADVTVLGDGSGGYPNNSTVNAGIGALWGAFDIVPDWPVNEGLDPTEWGIPTLWLQSGLHAPQVRFGRFDYAYDGVQEQFLALAGFGVNDVLEAIEANDMMLDDAGVDVARYTAPGAGHTVLRSAAFYSLEVEGVPLHEWVGAFLAGDHVPNVRCSVCS